MSLKSPVKILAITTLLSASCLLGPAPASAAVSDGVKCGQSIAKGVAKCVKTVVLQNAKCFKTTGAACASNDAKVIAAYQKLGAGFGSKCYPPAIASAGYGPLFPTDLSTRLTDRCKAQVARVKERTFASDGSRYTGATEDEKKCLLTAATETAKFISGAYGGISKCLGKACIADETLAVTKANTKITSKCPTFAALAGTSVAEYVEEASVWMPDALTAPCDPLDPTRCLFPFPNNNYTISDVSAETGIRLAIAPNALPRRSDTPLVNFNAVRFNEADGFSVGPMLLMNDVNIDLAMTGATPITDIATSLDADAPVVIIDADTGEKQLLWVERDLRGATIADQPIIIRVAKNLKEDRRYIVAMRSMKNSGGTTVAPGSVFAAYRDSTPTDILAVEGRRPHMEKIFEALDDAGIARNDLYLAWDFTTQSSDSTAGRLLTIRDDAFDILGAAAPAFTVDTVTNAPAAGIFRYVDGTFQVPLYLTGTGESGSGLKVDANGVPIRNTAGSGNFTAAYRCIIPNTATTGGAAPAVPARISLYGHGLLGSHTEVDAGNVRAFSSEHNIIFCATDWTGFSDDDTLFVVQVVTDFSLFPKFIDRQHQGILNAMFLGRLMKHASGFASNAAFQVGGQSMLDTSDLFYDGNSQGGILGGVLAAFSQDATRFSLGVPGINYSTLLNRSIDFDDFDLLLQASYPASTDRNLLLSTGQILWDRTDPNGHVNHVLADPYEGTPAKKILYQVAFGDHQVAPVTVEVAARSNGASIHTPVVPMSKVLPEVTPYYGIPAIPMYPFDGSAMVVWDSGNPAPPTGNIPPPEITDMDPEWADLGPCPQGRNSDPHSCPRSNADARTQKSEFLKTGGAIIDVCGGAACLAP